MVCVVRSSGAKVGLVKCPEMSTPETPGLLWCLRVEAERRRRDEKEKGKREKGKGQKGNRANNGRLLGNGVKNAFATRKCLVVLKKSSWRLTRGVGRRGASYSLF